MIKALAFTIGLFFCNFIYAQNLPKTILIDGNTCIAFSIKQSKQLILWDLERLECIDIQRNSELIINEIDSLLILKDEEIKQYLLKDIIYNQTLDSYQQLVEIHKIQEESCEQKIKMQKRKGFKNICLSIGSTFLASYFILKL